MIFSKQTDMISAGRESTVAGGHDGHSATTDAGEDSSEVKYQASDGTSKAQATSCETEVLPPTSSISESGTGSDGNASEQQPMRKSTLGRPGDCKKAEASRGDAGAESMSLLARASRVSENQESTTPSGSAEPSPSKLAPLSVPLDGPTNQSMAGMPLTSALASPACLHGTGADIPLLASLGQQISTVDRANHQAVRQVALVSSIDLLYSCVSQALTNSSLLRLSANFPIQCTLIAQPIATPYSWDVACGSTKKQGRHSTSAWEVDSRRG